MSNHSGSYMLNDILKLLETNQVLELLGKTKTHHLVRDIVHVSHDCDCNAGEILWEIGERHHICQYEA